MPNDTNTLATAGRGWLWCDNINAYIVYKTKATHAEKYLLSLGTRNIQKYNYSSDSLIVDILRSKNSSPIAFKKQPIATVDPWVEEEEGRFFVFFYWLKCFIFLSTFLGWYCWKNRSREELSYDSTYETSRATRHHHDWRSRHYDYGLTCAEVKTLIHTAGKYSSCTSIRPKGKKKFVSETFGKKAKCCSFFYKLAKQQCAMWDFFFNCIFGPLFVFCGWIV